jgi:hypothetical protein
LGLDGLLEHLFLLAINALVFISSFLVFTNHILLNVSDLSDFE